MIETAAQTLLTLGAILATARLLGALAVRLHQPRVGGEMVAGLLVGAALLSPWRGTGGAVMTPGVLHVVDLLGTVGVTLYCMIVGLALSPSELRRHGRRILGVGGALILAAFALAPLAAHWFAAASWGLTMTPVLVVAAALMVNGFPIVARILEERDALHGDLGCTVLGTSALLMVAPFVLLAVAEAGFDAARLVATLAVGGGLAVAWPRLHRGSGGALGAAVAVAVGLGAAWVTARVLGTGLLGGFAVGVGLSSSTETCRVLRRALGRAVPALLIPIFLGSAGARIDPTQLDPHVIEGTLVFLGLLLAVAGLAAGAAARRFDPVELSTIAALLNCRGLVLLALGVSMVDHHLIGPRLVAVFFLGAVATTLMTGPLLRWGRRAPALA